MTTYSREQWGARYPRSTRVMKLPAVTTFIHHSVTKGGPRELAIVRMIEEVHHQKFGVAVGYSWIVAPSGNIYEGQGWNRVGAHTEKRNSTSHGICFLGDFTNDTVTSAAMESAASLIRYGRAQSFISQFAPIEGHRAVKQTACPGENLYAQLDTLRNLVNQPLPAPESPRSTRFQPLGDEVFWYRILGDTTNALYVRHVDGLVHKIDGAPNEHPALPYIATVAKTQHEQFVWVSAMRVQVLQQDAT